ncbi:MAG: hypothetical protein LBU32_07525 [Clostridiales bacterium]|jgi:hypothetical protein|nr:hypothetical protein [Clostridiales bacterium]
MSIQEVWEIKEQISKETSGKTTQELRDFFKPSLDEFNSEIAKIRKQKLAAV